MSNNNFTPLLHFLHEEVSILELELNDKSHLWLKIVKASGDVTPLSFKTASNEIVNENEISIRIFDGAELRFAKDFAKFSQAGNSHILKTNDVKDITSDITTSIEKYLSK